MDSEGEGGGADAGAEVGGAGGMVQQVPAGGLGPGEIQLVGVR